MSCHATLSCLHTCAHVVSMQHPAVWLKQKHYRHQLLFQTVAGKAMHKCLLRTKDALAGVMQPQYLDLLTAEQIHRHHLHHRAMTQTDHIKQSKQVAWGDSRASPILPVNM